MIPKCGAKLIQIMTANFFKMNINSLYKWAIHNKMMFHPGKCKVLIGWQAYRGDQIHRKNSPT